MIDSSVAEPTLPSRVGHYSILRRLGEGGMGVVYAARDEKLQRTVALKTMLSIVQDETARRRFWREARAAASVNHPNICQIHEIGEDNGQLFIAMELLEGEVLSDRLRHGALSLAEVMPIGLGMLSALSALHAAGIVHRDLKPSNVFLTAHGVKLLDFGLARPQLEEAFNTVTVTEVTRDGMIVGTPRYMAPEQISGETVDSRGDLFAAGAILFEMLAGRPAFVGRSIVEILHATRFEQPPALTGSPAVAAVDRVIRRALAKRPADRPPSATVMAEELRAITGADGHDTASLAHPLTRLVVLPFRVLRPDPETDFLAFSLPDAITTSLGATRSLVLRSSAVAARFAAEAPNLKTLATEADVDCVVMGTLLRAGDQLRVSAQLIEAPSGTVLTSHTVTSSMGDLFQLQDDMARRIVEALSPPLTATTTPPPTPDRPHDARAYELYLRANELARTFDGLPGRARSVSAEPRARFAIRTGLGEARPLLPRDRQVHRRRARQRVEGRGRLPPRAGFEPAAVDRAQVLRESGGRDRAGRARHRAPDRRGDPSRQRSRAVLGPGARLPLLWPVRAVDRRPRGGAPARSQHLDRCRADVPARRRSRAAAGHRASGCRFWRRRGHSRDRPGARGKGRRSARTGGGHAPRLAHSDLRPVDGSPDGLARPPIARISTSPRSAT